MNDARAESSYKDLADATPEDLGNCSADDGEGDDVGGAPVGFRFLAGSFFPCLKGHIVRNSVDSASEYAKRIFFDNGCMVEDPYMPDSNESISDTRESGNDKRSGAEMSAPLPRGLH